MVWSSGEFLNFRCCSLSSPFVMMTTRYLFLSAWSVSVAPSSMTVGTERRNFPMSRIWFTAYAGSAGQSVAAVSNMDMVMALAPYPRHDMLRVSISKSCAWISPLCPSARMMSKKRRSASE